MSFSRDMNSSSPPDHSKNSSWPLQIRSLKVDMTDRLGDIIAGFNSGETVKGIKNLPFIAGSAPAVVADQIQIYAKDVSGKTELFTKTEDDEENQVTSGGKFAMSAAEILAAVGPLLMPVGTVITLGVSTNPATLFGFGTWTAISGKVIVGIDATQTEFDTLDETGGEKTHTLTTAEMPSHAHYIDNNQSNYAIGSNAYGLSSNGSTLLSGSTGGGGAHNNLQPYQVKYIWQRTA